MHGEAGADSSDIFQGGSEVGGWGMRIERHRQPQRASVKSTHASMLHHSMAAAFSKAAAGEGKIGRMLEKCHDTK